MVIFPLRGCAAAIVAGGGGHGGERGSGARVRFFYPGRGGEIPGHVAHPPNLRKDGVVHLPFHLRRLHGGHQEGARLLALRRIAKGEATSRQLLLLILRWTILNGTYGTHKKLYIHLF